MVGIYLLLGSHGGYTPLSGVYNGGYTPLSGVYNGGYSLLLGSPRWLFPPAGLTTVVNLSSR